MLDGVGGWETCCISLVDYDGVVGLCADGREGRAGVVGSLMPLVVVSSGIVKSELRMLVSVER